ncbi:MAG: CBS domain-containing protein [Neomegalonema sp.]|nr:CBS domain-containing protein [Neomegalonema sp.]
MRVSDILTQKTISGVASIGRRETMLALSQRLAENKVGALVVLDESEEMVGVVSERDIVKALSERADAALSDPIERHMTVAVETATPSESTQSVLERMTSGRFRHMPVLDGGALIGVVSIGDIVKARIELLTQEKRAMEEFIRS